MQYSLPTPSAISKGWRLSFLYQYYTQSTLFDWSGKICNAILFSVLGHSPPLPVEAYSIESYRPDLEPDGFDGMDFTGLLCLNCIETVRNDMSYATSKETSSWLISLNASTIVKEKAPSESGRVTFAINFPLHPKPRFWLLTAWSCLSAILALGVGSSVWLKSSATCIRRTSRAQ